MAFRIRIAVLAMLAAAAPARPEPAPAAAASAAVATVLPGDPAVDGRIIVPFRNKWKLVGRAADGSVVEMGTWTDDVRIGTIDGREVIRRRQIWVHDKGAEGYFNIVDRRTLAPLLSQYVNASGLYYRIEYGKDGRTARYQRTPWPPGEGSTTREWRPDDPMQQGEIGLDAPLFDFNSGMFGLLIAGFPLKEGYKARFPVFRSYEPRKEPAWIDFEVRGRETAPAGPGRSVEAWLVVAHSPDTGEVMTFDIVKEAPYIIRLRQAWQGRDWTFEML